ncbi:Carboxypeptidase C (cathepsin A) [Spirosomataceae bacterium TFI 002]|nr:Carboxypeptidase C (cathepsin A) [Spirosomataceae bacterium TFI 002]
MLKSFSILVLFLSSILNLAAQKKQFLPIDSTVVTKHSATINGKTFAYTATTGFQPVWDENGQPIASLYYTYYKREDVKNIGERPLLFSFNGGPGSASVWMHLAYTGPMVLNIDDEGYPVQPYGYKENPYSILDVADVIYINPVNTGYSRTIPMDGKDVKKEKFFGINADIEYLADWLNTFVTRSGRWTSPKYMIGESYGGTRVAGLAYKLQQNAWMYLNGIIMVSPADYKIYGTDAPLASALNLPYFTAAAWYHKMLPANLQSQDLEAILPAAEDFTINELSPALTMGGFISPEKKNEIAEKMSRYTGLSKKVILQNNLDIATSLFWKELLRDRDGYTIGRLDSRYLGIDKSDGGTRTDFNPELTSWLHSFTPAINEYIRKELNFKTDLQYNMFGNVGSWNRDNDNTRDNLRQALAQNPYMKVLYQAGYYDGATNYFNTKYSMWQLDPSGKLKDRLSFKGYRSGHMMYLRKEDLKTANDDIRNFILSTNSNGKSAKY